MPNEYLIRFKTPQSRGYASEKAGESLEGFYALFVGKSDIITNYPINQLRKILPRTKMQPVLCGESKIKMGNKKIILQFEGV